MSKTQDTKADKSLGLLVRDNLIVRGIETPMTSPQEAHQAASPSTPLYAIRGHVSQIMQIMGLDLKDDSLSETPTRVAKMFLNELFWGLDYNNFPKATVVENKMHYDEMVLERNITVHSTCEHHLLPILGNAQVAYIPSKKVLGLSKLNRIVEFFARRPQIQERLTVQIGETLKFLLETENVAVCIDAEHLCVKTRGVEDACSDTVTSFLSGDFKTNPQTRAEFFSLVNLNKG